MLRISFIIWIILQIPYLLADEDGFDFDLEYYIKQKSTLNDFPLQEIGQDELSNAAIAGALQASSTKAIGKKGKPAYAEQQDITDKRKESELETDEIGPSLDDILRHAQQSPPPLDFQKETYAVPTGLTSEVHLLFEER